MSEQETTAGHTAGPWGVAVNTTTGSFRVVASEGQIIAERSSWPTNEAWSIANARLIASAPDLLEALTKATSQIAIWRSINGDMVGALSDLESECRAAIARARGEA